MWAALALLVAITGCSRPEPAAHPPIVLLSIDTLRSDALRAFDPEAPPAPHLDAFAAESVRFQRALSTAPWTLPAHASLFTGLYPPRHGATDRRVRLAADMPTLAESLAQLGYECVAITGGGFLRASFGLGRGFHHYDASSQVTRSGDQAAELFDSALAVLEARRADSKPLFLFLHSFAVHDYFALHPWAVEQLSTPMPRKPAVYFECLQGERTCSWEEWRMLRELYAAELRHFDQGFGRLLDALAANQALASAVVVVLSDHGEGFEPTRSRIHHGGRLHEDQLRIPLLVRAPGVGPRDVEAPISLVDVMPSLVELAGGTAPPTLDGVSFVPALRGRTLDGDRTIFAHEYNSLWSGDEKIRAEEILEKPLAVGVVRGDRWYLRSGEREEVYDVAEDPRQMRDLGEGARGLEALRAAADAAGATRHAAPRVEQDEELQNQLRALGYVN